MHSLRQLPPPETKHVTKVKVPGHPGDSKEGGFCRPLFLLQSAKATRSFSRATSVAQTRHIRRPTPTSDLFHRPLQSPQIAARQLRKSPVSRCRRREAAFPTKVHLSLCRMPEIFCRNSLRL